MASYTPSVGTQPSCTTIQIRRNIPDRLIHLNRCLSHVSEFTIIGPVTKVGKQCYSVPCSITCKQGTDIPWHPQLYFRPGYGWRVTGIYWIGEYAATPIRNAIFNCVCEYIRSEGAES